MWVGNSEKALRKVFEEARTQLRRVGYAPVIFFDEAEALFGKRTSGERYNHANTLVPQLLTELDGFDENGIYVILATNLPESIDPAVLREGRIDAKVYIGPPDKEEVVRMLELYLHGVDRANEYNLLESVTESLFDAVPKEKRNALSGALVAEIARRAKLNCLSEFEQQRNGSLPPLSRRHLQAAVQKCAHGLGN